MKIDSIKESRMLLCIHICHIKWAFAKMPFGCIVQGMDRGCGGGGGGHGTGSLNL